MMKPFNYKFHVFPLINPLIWDSINHMGKYSGVSEHKREVPVIVSLTSYNERFKDLPKTLYSLMNQSFKPDRIVLWLDKYYEDLSSLPYEITMFVKNGLEIKFAEDIKSYTKVIYTFKEFQNSIIVTADDDIYYRKHWLRNLYLSYIANPDDIQVHRAHRVKLSGEEILPYKEWEKHVNEETARFDNFLTGVGGVLYPPNCFSTEVLRKDIFLKYAPNADDIWLWVMALIHNRKIRVIKNHYKTLIITNLYKHIYANTLYKRNYNGGNDVQLNNLMRFYGQNVMNKLI